MYMYNIAGTSADDSSSDWKKCQAVARIIASCPSGASTVEEYYSLICPQVNKLASFGLKFNVYVGYIVTKEW